MGLCSNKTLFMGIEIRISYNFLVSHNFFLHLIFSTIKNVINQDFPGGPEVKSPHANA